MAYDFVSNPFFFCLSSRGMRGTYMANLESLYLQYCHDSMENNSRKKKEFQK